MLQLADEPGTVADVAVSPDGDHAYLAHLGRSTRDFWGVEVFVPDGSTYVLGCDRDSGLWIFEDTARHGDDHEH